MPRNVTTDPFYRALLAELADTEWQIVESEFSGQFGGGMPVARARVLVVDDDPDTVDTVVACLTLEGHTCSVGYSGEEALQLCASSPFDCLVIDYRLGGMSGLSVAEKLSPTDQRPRRIVLVTGRGIEDFVESINGGVIDHYLQKPVPLDALEDLVRGSVGSEGASNVRFLSRPR